MHALFRLSTDAENRLSDNAKAGDRTLMYTVGDGHLFANTYSFTYTSSEITNIEEGIPYEDDLESWFWVYFGYNRVE